MFKLSNTRSIYGITATALLLTMTLSAPAQTTNFDAGGDGFSWTDPLNWDNSEPNGSTFNVVIDGAVGTPFDVQLPTSTARTVGTVRVGDGDILRLLNGSSLLPSDLVPASQVTINTGGTLIIQSAGGNTTLRTEVGIVNLTGGGTLEMVGAAARIGDTAGIVDGEMVNLDLLIHGQGQIGLNRTKLSNFGTIRADVVGALLNIDPDARNMVNEGTLEATNQGILQLNFATYTNTLGDITAQADSIVRLTGGPRINGGNLNTIGTGVIETGNATKSTLDGVTLDGLLRLNNAASIELIGTITNNAASTILINSGGSNTNLQIEGPVILTGGGTVQMVGAARLGDTVGTVDGDLTNANNLIHGQGNIGQNRTKITNNSTIRADVNGATLVLDPDSRGMVNTSLLEATNGATLQLSTATYTNTAATIRAQTGSIVTLFGGPTIVGGTLQTVGDGLFETGNATKSTLDNVTLDGLLRLNNAASIELIGTITNNAASTILINSGGSNTNLQIEGNVTLTGGGTVQMVGAARLGDTGGLLDGDLTNANNLIHGQGNIGQNRTKITNNSTIRADVNGGTLVLDPDIRGMVNTSLLEATNGATLQLNPGTYTNTAATIRAQAGSNVTFFSGPTIVGGTLQAVGTGVFETGNATITRLDGITLDGLLRLNNAASIELIGTITNSAASTILINSTGGNTNLQIEGPVTLTGGGTVEMVGFARIGDTAGLLNGDLTNANNLIHGEGNIGIDRTKITNNSTIRADVNGGTLVLDPDIRGMVNTSLLEATNGATLQLNPGTFTNTAATIRAQADSNVTFLSGPTIVGGTLQAVGTGVFETGNATITRLDGITLDGLLRINNADNIELQGTITNNAASTILINSTISSTDLIIEGTVTLNGGGTIEMAGTAPRILDDAGLLLGHLINNDNLIHGRGSIGSNRTKITNNSTIRADIIATTLILDPDSVRDFVNTGLMEATNGATLQFNPGTFTNTGGTLRAQAGSNVTFLSGPTIVGGTLQTVGDGVFETANATITRLDGITLDGLLRINNADNIELQGTVTNNAASLIQINAAGSFTDLLIEGDVTLTGGGTVELVGTLARIRDDSGLLLGNLTNVNNLIHGQGNIGGGRMQLTNGGTISSDVAAGTLIIDTDVAPRVLANTGTLQAINTSTLRIVDAFANDGAIIAAAGSTVRIDGTLTNNASGTLSGGGLFQMGSTGIVDIQNDGTISPGASPGGLLMDVGTLTFGATGNLTVELGGLVAGTDYDRVDVLGDVVLAGTLDATIFGGFPLTIGDTFDVLVASGSITGTFDTVNLPAGPGAGFGIFYGSNFVRLTVGLIQGDLNFDGFVGISDLNIVLGNWNLNVTPGDISVGDPSGDGFVGIDDLNAVLGNWNGGTAFPSAPTPPAATASVPEPATVGLMMLGGIVLAGRRRH